MKDAITNYINENYPESSDKILLADGVKTVLGKLRSK